MIVSLAPGNTFGSSMKIINAASGVESYSVLFQISQSAMGDLCLSRPGGGGESHHPPAVQRANGESSRALGGNLE